MPNSYSIIIAFVDPSEDNRIRHALRDANVNGVTILYGRGTVRNAWFRVLGLDNPRKEILIIVTEEGNRENIMRHLYDGLHMERHGHGVCASLPVTRVYGLRTQDADGYSLPAICDEKSQACQYELIVNIVNHGKAAEVLTAAHAGGATGATVLHGRGSGIHKVEKFFHLEIEPEKEVILIVSGADATDAIIDSIRHTIDFNTPNSGILFTLDITGVVGLVANA